MQRYSSQELYELRNFIPIGELMQHILIPVKIIAGHLRFQCPLCENNNTAINPKTNLSRCFDCEKNFNTIDLVMITRKVNFIDSVRFLKNYLGDASCPNANVKAAIKNNRTEHTNGLVSLGEILTRAMARK